MKSLSVKPLLFTVVLALLNGAIVKVAAFRSDASLAIKARSSTRVYSTGSTTEQHPAVQGWPEKYTGTPTSAVGPRLLHEGFFVEKATDHTLNELDVLLANMDDERQAQMGSWKPKCRQSHAI